MPFHILCIFTSVSVVNGQPNQCKTVRFDTFYLRLESHPLGRSWGLHKYILGKHCICVVCVHILRSHIRLQRGAGLNIVVAMKPWHSPLNMLKSVLITETRLNLHPNHLCLSYWRGGEKKNKKKKTSKAGCRPVCLIFKILEVNQTLSSAGKAEWSNCRF